MKQKINMKNNNKKNKDDLYNKKVFKEAFYQYDDYIFVKSVLTRNSINTSRHRIFSAYCNAVK